MSLSLSFLCLGDGIDSFQVTACVSEAHTEGVPDAHHEAPSAAWLPPCGPFRSLEILEGRLAVPGGSGSQRPGMRHLLRVAGSLVN